MLVLIVLLGFPIHSEAMKEVLAYIGSNVTLYCNLSGNISLPEWQGPPKLTTYCMQGGNIFNTDVPSVAGKRLSWTSTQYRDLLLTSVAMSDAGMYQCIYAGHGFYSFYLNVTYKANDGTTDSAVTSYYQDSTEADKKSTGATAADNNYAVPVDNSSAGKVAAAVILILMWLCSSCVLLYVLRTGNITNEVINAIGKPLKEPFYKPQTILLFVSCCFLIGWIYLLVQWLIEEERCHLPTRITNKNKKIRGSTSVDSENAESLLSAQESKQADTNFPPEHSKNIELLQVHQPGNASQAAGGGSTLACSNSLNKDQNADKEQAQEPSNLNVDFHNKQEQDNERGPAHANDKTDKAGSILKALAEHNGAEEQENGSFWQCENSIKHDKSSIEEDSSDDSEYTSASEG